MKHRANSVDFLVIGAGIAGLSAAAELCDLGRVAVIEAEPGLAQHASGRSAAVFINWYGGELVRPFTNVSRAWFEEMAGFAAGGGLLSSRGLLLVADHGDEHLLTITGGDSVERLSCAEVLTMVPCLRKDKVSQALYDSSAADINVSKLITLHERRIKSYMGRIITNARAVRIRRNRESWSVETGKDSFDAGILVNCAGAWADEISIKAGLTPIGLNHFRRTVCIFKSDDPSLNKWPLVYDARGRFYFRPYYDSILASPDDEIPSPPLDAQPDDRDVARTVSEINEATTMRLNAPVDRWAGLRTFSPDRGIVIGPHPEDHSFIWCAGLGGVGFQTSPAVAACVASLVQSGELPSELANAGITAESVSPERFLAS